MDMNFFAAMAWKSALIAGAALAFAFALRSRAAADRALVLKIGVAMLLALPAIALFLPALQVVAWPAPAAVPLPPLSDAQLAALLAAAPASPAPAPTIWDDPTPLVILAYLGGLAMAGARLLAGLVTLRRWTRTARPVTDAAWVAALERVRWSAPAPDAVRLLVADAVASPLSWGWRRPTILIDPDTLADDVDAEAVLAHEIAHITRRDWPALIASRLAAALFWFNPLVWMLEREVVQQAEEAADREAAERVEPVRYAETLLGLAQVNGLVPANNIAPSARALARRVKAILDRADRPQGSAWTALAALACIGLAAPVAAMQLVAAPPAPPAAAVAPDAPEAPQAPDVRAAPGAPDAPEAPRPPRPPHAVADGDAPVALPDIDAIVADAMRAASAATPQAIEQAMRQIRNTRELTPAQRARIQAALREARVQIRDLPRVQIAAIPRVRIEAAMRQAQAVQVQAQAEASRAVALAMTSGGGMMHGADGMEAGARNMEQQAARLRDPAYRAQAIERARQRGETLTDRDLIDAADGLEDGARGMRDGAREMRDAARRMQHGGADADDD